MTTLDWIVVGFAAVTALAGFRRGLIRTVLSLAGLIAGAVIGARIAPHLLHHSAYAHYAALVGLGGGVIGAVLLQAAASIIGSFLRTGLRFAPPLRLLDSLGGLVAGAAFGLALAWVVGAVAVQIPGHHRWALDVSRSQVLRRLDKIAPPRDVLRLRASLLLNQLEH